METKVSTPKSWLREIDVVIEPEKLKSRVSELLEEYQDKAEVDGFRKGKVPHAVLVRRFSEPLESAAVEELVESAITEVLEKQKFKPAARPRLTDLEIKPDKTITFKLSVEVFPEFELKDYSSLKLKKEEPKGFDQEFEKRLLGLQEKCATFKAVSRESKQGDFVVVDYQLSDGDKPVGDRKTNVMIEVGDKMSFEAVNKALVGVKADDDLTVEVEMPADHPEKALAGKAGTYRFVVREVKEKLLPEVDEEFAQDLGFDDLDALRKEINEQIMSDRVRLVENGLKNQIFDYLTREHDFEPPDTWVRVNFERMREEYRLPADEDTTKRLTPIAVRWAKFDIIAARIADNESIEVTEDEVQRQIEELVRGTGRSVEEVAPLLDNPSSRSRMLRDKVLKFILKNAEIS